MLADLNNLDANYGALIYPNYPENWDDFTGDEKMWRLVLYIASNNPGHTHSGTQKEARKSVDLAWNQLPTEYQALVPPLAIHKFIHPASGKKARFHFEQTLSLIRMPPDQSEISIRLRNESLEEIFKAIISRIPLTV
ncbi:MAG: hypothetical protein OEW49_06570 [Nitrosopumilus sp.]|nr:hypothetical protein [Nitrosopumilus sp.]